LTGHLRSTTWFVSTLVLASIATAAATAVVGCSPASRRSQTAVGRGGQLVVSVRIEPRTYNRFASRTETDLILSMFTQSRLFRVNHVTDEVEPWLVEQATRSKDGLRYTLTLPENVTFSDGHPFSADDVVFSFEAAYDEKANGTLNDVMRVGGKKLRVEKLDPRTIAITFPSPYAPGLRILDNLPIVPRHKLEPELAAGTLTKAWGISTPPADIVGLGPFVPVEYLPGQHMTLARNPRYWRKDANGVQLPYVDRVTLEVVPEQDAELLRLESGQVDMTTSEIRPEDYAPLKRAADEGRVKLMDLGVILDPDSFWVNLRPAAPGSDRRAEWLQRDEFRHAVSMAVDRQLFVDEVFLGAAVPVYGPVTPSNKKWYSAGVPHVAHDPERARQLLASIGLVDRNGDGLLEDARNQPVRFTLLTVKGRTALERGAAVIRDELRKVGIMVDVAFLEPPAVMQRLVSNSNYDALGFHVGTTDTDPASNADFWLSSGSTHIWNIAEKTPATDWERRIDDLMAKQMATPDDGERSRLLNEVQRIFAEHEPVLYFAAPRVFAAASSRVTNVVPAVNRPQLLWSPDTIAVVH
jgi:peptide/nickel transport system substrate-binding protein